MLGAAPARWVLACGAWLLFAAGCNVPPRVVIKNLPIDPMAEVAPPRPRRPERRSPQRPVRPVKVAQTPRHRTPAPAGWVPAR